MSCRQVSVTAAGRRVTAQVRGLGVRVSYPVALRISSVSTRIPGVRVVHCCPGVSVSYPRITALVAPGNLRAFLAPQQVLTRVEHRNFVARVSCGGGGGGGGSGVAVRYGSGPPENSLGTNGDTYIDVDDGGFYEKVAGSYVLRLDVALPADIVAALAAHVASADPHPQYLTQAEADALYDALGAAAAVQAALDAHEADFGNPHQVTAAQAGADPAGTAAAAVAAHEAAGDPHPQYLTEAEGDVRYDAAGTAAAAIAAHNADDAHPHKQVFVESPLPEVNYNAIGFEPVTIDGVDGYFMSVRA